MMHAFLFTVLCLSWGSTWIAIKVGVDLVPPFFLAGTRFLAAGILILAAVRIVSGREALRVDRADIPSLLWMSAMVVSICFALIFWGERFVTASVAAIVVQGMIPILLPLVDKLGIDKVWFCILVAVCLQTAWLSPPVALSAYFLKGVVPNWPLKDIYFGMMQFMVLQVIGLLMVLAWPEIALWLPGVLRE